MTDDGSLANQVRGLNPKAWVRVPNAFLLHPGFAELRGSSVKVWLVVAAHRNRESGRLQVGRFDVGAWIKEAS